MHWPAPWNRKPQASPDRPPQTIESLRLRRMRSCAVRTTSALVHMNTSDCRTTAARLSDDCRMTAARLPFECRASGVQQPGGAHIGLAVRRLTSEARGMNDDAIDKVLAGLSAQPYAGRSALYRWLRANHSRLSRRLARDQTSWAVMASEIAAVGILNREGKPPSSDSVRRVWATVCRDVTADQAAKAAKPNRKYPSRISPDWRPQVVQPPLPVQPPPPTRHPMPATAPAPAGSLPAGSSKPSGDGIVISPEAQARIDRAMERLAADDRKKFRFGG